MKKTTVCLIIFILAFGIFCKGSFADNREIIDNLDKYNFDDQDMNDYGQYSSSEKMKSLLIYLIFFIMISVLAYFTTRWIANHQRKLTIKSKYMEVVDNLHLGSDKGIYIVRAPQGLLMLGVSKEGIFLLEKLGTEETEIIIEAEMNHVNPDKSFALQLNHFLNKLKNSSGHNKKHGGLK